MNEPENQILKSEIFKKKKNMKMPCFLFNYRGVRKWRSYVLGFLNDS